MEYLHLPSAIAALLILPGLAVAEQGAVTFTPRLTEGQPLTVELRNLSKLPVRLTDGNLTFPRSTSAASCTFALTGPVELAPAEMKTVTLAARQDVARCAGQTDAVAPTERLSVMTEPEAARRDASLRAADKAGVPAALGYRVEIGSHTVGDSTNWHFAAE
jgi:hypothetical protein